MDVAISAVIPTYNRADTIKRAVDSVLAQRCPPSEIVVIDDGSRDGTADVVASFGDRIRYVYQENGGVSVARNRGVAEASCEWIAFLDSDDCWLPDHLQMMAEAIEATGGTGALYFADALWPAVGGTIRYWDLCGFGIEGDLEIRDDAIEWAMMARQPMLLQSSVLSRSRFLEDGGLPPNLLVREDTFLFYRLCAIGPVCAVGGCGVVMHPDGQARLTAKYGSGGSAFWECSVALFDELLSRGGLPGTRWRTDIGQQRVDAHLGLARALLREMRLCGAVRNVGIASSIDSTLAFRQMREYLGSFARNRLEKAGLRRRHAARGRPEGH